MWYLCTGAFAASLYASQDLTEIAYDECKMRQQLISCIEVGDITLFPHEHVASNTADKGVYYRTNFCILCLPLDQQWYTNDSVL